MEVNMKQVEFLTTKEMKESLNKDFHCESEAIKKVIQRWCESHFWKFENFPEFLSLMELKPPFVIRANTDPSYVPAKREYCYECVTANGSVLISFFSFSCEITLIEKKKKKTYVVNANNYKILDHPPFFYLKKKTVDFEGKTVCHEITNSMYHCLIKIDDIHSLSMDFSLEKPLKDILPDSPLRNTKLDEYLFNLPQPIHIWEMYVEIGNLLGFSFSNSLAKKIASLCYYELMFEKKEERAKVLIKNGLLIEFAILKGDKTYHSYLNGNWEFLSPHLYYSYDKNSDRYTKKCNRKDLFDDKNIFAIEKEIAEIGFF